MKAKSFLAGLIVLMSTVAFANDGPGSPRVAVLRQKNSSIFKVIYASEKAGKVNMTILDKNKNVVFAETTSNTDGFMRPVNFSGMEAGEYTIQISSNGETQTKVVDYTTSASSIQTVKISKIAKNGNYLLSVANSGTEKINVKIFDGANNLVHTEDRIIDGNFGLVYNLSNVTGAPTFEVTDNTGTVRTIKY